MRRGSRKKKFNLFKSERVGSTSDARDGHLSPATSPDTELEDDYFTVHSVEDLERLLDYLDKVHPIEPPQQSDRTSSVPEGDANPRAPKRPRSAIPQSIIKNLDDAEKILGNVTKGCLEATKPHQGLSRDIHQESYKIFRGFLQKVGSLHWAAAGFSVVAVVLKRFDMTEANKKKCEDLLVRLRELGRQVVKLYPHFPDDDAKLKKATLLMVEGALLCWNHLESNSFAKRFLFASVNEGKFEALTERIQNIYQDMQLDVGIALLEQSLVPLASSVPENLRNAVGLQEKVLKIMKIMGLEEKNKINPGSRVVNLNGMGGIGKSTLAMEITAQAIPAFQTGRCHARVEVGENPGEAKICQLQKDILERLSGKRPPIGDCREGRQRLNAYLKTRQDPILLFIDNIFQPTDLQMLLPDQLDQILVPQSRIVITSRPNPLSASQILMEKGIHDCHEYFVPELDDNHARELLCRHVFSSAVPPSGKETAVASILKRCGGLPLALEVVGQYLRNHRNDNQRWKNAQKNLEDFLPLDGSSESKLHKALEFTYNQLRPTYKTAFLDVSCLLRGMPWNTVKRCITELEDLEKWGLVKRLGSQKFGIEVEVVMVHDLLVALAESKQPSKSVRLFAEDVDEFAELPAPFQHNDNATPVEGVVVRRCGSSISAEWLDDMYGSLRILILEDVIVDGRYTKISKKLQMCIVPDVLGGTLAHLKDLRVLKIDFSRGQFSSLDFGQLSPSCKEVRLEQMDSLKELPAAVGGLVALEKLDLIGCKSLERLPREFGELVALEELTLAYCESLKELPAAVRRLVALEKLNLRGCRNLRRLPDDIARLKSLKKLDVGICKSLEELPREFGRLVDLEELCLDYCEGLKELPRTFGGLVGLKVLILVNCRSLTKLPNDFAHLKSLKKLNMSCCRSLEELPLDFGRLVDLEELKFQGCESLKELPTTFGGLVGLKVLNVWSHKGLRKLPDDFVHLKSLKKLILFTCKNLEELPSEFGGLVDLEELSLSGCMRLKELPGTFGGLVGLKVLSLNCCTGLTKLPDDFDHLKALKTLDMSLCWNLEELPNDFGRLVDLEGLSLYHCKCLKELPGTFGGLVGLKVLSLNCCTGLTKLPDDFDHLKALKTLDMSLCWNLEELPNDFGRLVDLEELNLYRCTRLKELPRTFGGLVGLRGLNLRSCESLTKLPEDFVHLKSLQKLLLSFDSSLEGLPSEFAGLVELDGRDRAVWKSS